MQEVHLERRESLPPDSEKILQLFERLSYPRLPEGQAPEVGKFYRLYPPDCYAGNNKPYHGSIRVGQEPDKLIIFLNGGGVAYDEYTVARPNNLFSGDMKDTYYLNDCELIGDFALMHGMCAKRDDNPFERWSFIHLPYATGDFHCGDGEFPYTALDGTARMMKFYGYRNIMGVLDMSKKYIGSPKKLLIAGVSAGGFGVALLSDVIIGRFTECEGVTVAVDSSLLLSKKWRSIAENVWHSPDSILSKLTGENLTLDCLIDLHRKYGNRVRILFLSSTRDALLVMAQNGLDGKMLTFDEASGQKYQDALTKMCRQLIEAIPEIGLYIFEGPMDQPGFDEFRLTKHCVLESVFMHEHYETGKTPCQWLCDALNGHVCRVGLDYLGLSQPLNQERTGIEK